jgi:hypothetical protein
MIGQYLPNNNEKRYSAILPKKKFGSKPALSSIFHFNRIFQRRNPCNPQRDVCRVEARSI